MRKKDTKNNGSDDDGALWEKVTGGVKPYRTKNQLPAAVKKAPLPTERRMTAPSLPAMTKPTGKGFDRATETKMKKGQLPIEGRIDLHGMTQAEAHRALIRFVAGARSSGKRHLLVITGKGSVSEGGVLRRMLPLWCEAEDLAGHVLALTPAQPKDGGSGAFYLRLRKNPA
jgi:DNA-nicking Smr family endonuclease